MGALALLGKAKKKAGFFKRMSGKFKRSKLKSKIKSKLKKAGRYINRKLDTGVGAAVGGAAGAVGTIYGQDYVEGRKRRKQAKARAAHKRRSAK